MLCPQNGDRIVTKDTVTSLHPVYMRRDRDAESIEGLKNGDVISPSTPGMGRDHAPSSKIYILLVRWLILWNICDLTGKRYIMYAKLHGEKNFVGQTMGVYRLPPHSPVLNTPVYIAYSFADSVRARGRWRCTCMCMSQDVALCATSSHDPFVLTRVCVIIIIIIAMTMFMVLLSWPKSLRQFTRFIWWM